MLATLIASAVGLSCAGCLSTSSIETSTATLPSYKSYTSVETPDVVRVRPAAPDQVKFQPITSSRTYSNVQETRSHLSKPSTSHPLGSIRGIDIGVAEFASKSTLQRSSPLRYERRWTQEDESRIKGGYNFVADKEETGLGLDVSVNPRFDVQSSGDLQTTRGGAEVRLGQNLDKRGKSAKNSNWYFFAGADGEAVVWDVQQSNTSLLNGQVSLQDSVTVGDVQAGVAFQSPAGHMTVSYIEREYEYRNGEIAQSGNEDFVALTLSWRY